MLKILIDTGGADFLFDWNPIVVLLCGIVIDIILFVLSYYLNGEGNNKRIALLMVIIVFIAAVLAVLTQFVSIRCTRVPYYFDEDNIPYSQAALILRQENGLRCSEEFDDIARMKQNDGEDLISHSFYVTDCFPKPGTLVEKNTDVVLFVSWRPKAIGDGTGKNETENGQNLVYSRPVSNDDDVIENPFPDFDPRFCYPLNSNEFTLTVEELAVRMLTEGNEEWSLGAVPTTKVLMQVDLIDFDSGNIIDSKTAYLGDTVHFGDIPNGTYYYKIKCEGYKTGYSGSPFVFKYNGSEMKDNLPWITFLEKTDVKFGPGFKVKMLSSSEAILQYTETIISVTDKTGRSGSSYPAYINEDGFLTLWMGINDVDYYFIADFYVADGYTSTVFNKENNPIEAHPGSDGICILQY